MVTLPGRDPINITYGSFSELNITDDQGSGITTTLTNFMEGIDIESTITLTYLRNVSYDGAEIECRYGDYFDVQAVYSSKYYTCFATMFHIINC